MRAAVLSSLLRDKDGTAYPLVELGDVLSSGRYGTSTKCSVSGKGLPVLRIPNLDSGKLRLSDIKYAVDTSIDLAASLVADDDVLIIRTNGSRSLIGRAAVVSGLPQPMAFASYLIQLRVNLDLLKPAYLVAALRSPELRVRIEDLAATTAGQYNISLSKLRSLRIPLPPLSAQGDALEVAGSLLPGCDRIDLEIGRALTRSNQLRSSILACAFSGGFGLSDPADEPTEMLLKRVAADRDAASRDLSARITGHRAPQEQVVI